MLGVCAHITHNGFDVIRQDLGAFLSLEQIRHVRRQGRMNACALLHDVGELCRVSRFQTDDRLMPENTTILQKLIDDGNTNGRVRVDQAPEMLICFDDGLFGLRVVRCAGGEKTAHGVQDVLVHRELSRLA